ncbi:MAG TPA: DUF962 domain-containing protein [Saprospiraceae bacterium]|nr:DUF962 domain-containing protein [Saprospiraceae bacterium]
MQTFDQLLNKYGESHQNIVNKRIHWICIPAILFSLVGLLMHIPVPEEVSFNAYKNWAGLVLALSLIYYARLSFGMFVGFSLISFLLLNANLILINFCGARDCNSIWILLLIFTFAWIGQFVGHKIEGKKPSFFEDLQFLLIGPAWLLHFIYKKLSIPY